MDFDSYCTTPLVIPAGMRDGCIHTSLVEETILGIIHIILFKGSESWPNQSQFPLRLSKALPSESYNPCQMSLLKRAIQLLIFKCFMKGKNKFLFSFCIYKQNTGISSIFTEGQKRAAFPKQHFRERKEGGNFDGCPGYLHHTINLHFLQNHCSEFVINNIHVDSLPEWGHAAILYADQSIDLGGGNSITDIPSAHPTPALTPTHLRRSNKYSNRQPKHIKSLALNHLGKRGNQQAPHDSCSFMHLFLQTPKSLPIVCGI